MGEGVIGGSVIGEGVIGGSGYRWVVDAAVGLELMVSGRGDVLNAIVRLVGCTVPLEEGAIELAGIWLEVCSVLCKITDGAVIGKTRVMGKDECTLVRKDSLFSL